MLCILPKLLHVLIHINFIIVDFNVRRLGERLRNK